MSRSGIRTTPGLQWSRRVTSPGLAAGAGRSVSFSPGCDATAGGVPGVTSQRARSVLGSCRISAASTARPAESIRAWCGAARRPHAAVPAIPPSWTPMGGLADGPAAEPDEDQVEQARDTGDHHSPRPCLGHYPSSQVQATLGIRQGWRPADAAAQRPGRLAATGSAGLSPETHSGKGSDVVCSAVAASP
jgi:hypothetical protein